MDERQFDLGIVVIEVGARGSSEIESATDSCDQAGLDLRLKGNTAAPKYESARHASVPPEQWYKGHEADDIC